MIPADGWARSGTAVIDVDDYLDVCRPAWIILEKAGAVAARDRKVYVSLEGKRK